MKVWPRCLGVLVILGQVAADTTAAPKATTVAAKTTAASKATTAAAKGTTAAAKGTTAAAKGTTAAAKGTTVAAKATTAAPKVTTVAPTTTAAWAPTTTKKKVTTEAPPNVVSHITGVISVKVSLSGSMTLAKLSTDTKFKAILQRALATSVGVRERDVILSSVTAARRLGGRQLSESIVKINYLIRDASNKITTANVVTQGTAMKYLANQDLAKSGLEVGIEVFIFDKPTRVEVPRTTVGPPMGVTGVLTGNMILEVTDSVAFQTDPKAAKAISDAFKYLLEQESGAPAITVELGQITAEHDSGRRLGAGGMVKVPYKATDPSDHVTPNDAKKAEGALPAEANKRLKPDKGKIVQEQVKAAEIPKPTKTFFTDNPCAPMIQIPTTTLAPPPLWTLPPLPTVAANPCAIQAKFSDGSVAPGAALSSSGMLVWAVPGLIGMVLVVYKLKKARVRTAQESYSSMTAGDCELDRLSEGEGLSFDDTD